MPHFLQALIAIVASFAVSAGHGGKPATTPPVDTVQVQETGKQVSEVDKNMNPQETKLKNNGEANVKNKNTDEENGSDDSHKPDTTKVSATNTSSGKVMPAMVPMVAVEHSQSLEVSASPSPSPSTSPSPEPSAPVIVSSETSDSASFGQEVSNSQPESAKADGKAFGQATAQAAKNKNNKP